MPDASNDVINLVAGKLAALAGFRALRHFDLQLIGIDQIVCGHAETCRGNLLDRTAAGISVASGLKRSSSSPPSPVFDLPPMRFMAIASVS